MTSGILNLDKPSGMTSHDVVNAARRISGVRKIGHAGALDPMATGVLVLCVGRATRLAEYLTSFDKSYQATARLGIETDTYDAEGKVVQSNTVTIGREDVKAQLLKFSGAISQVPPMYSAIKQDGQPLYKLARRGITVERKPRRTVIHHIALTEWSPPEFSFQVTCSAGTYVRSLAHDLGQELNCGAHLTSLVRTGSGQLELDDAIPLSELTSENWESHLLPMEIAVAHFGSLTADEGEFRALIHGQSIARRPEHPVVDLARVYTPRNKFFALVKPSSDGSKWLPHKVFAN